MPEIERKYLVTSSPPPARRVTAIEQGYLAVDDGVEVRIRRRDGGCTLTVKSGTGRVRGEVELEIAAEVFEELWAMAAGRRIEKRRAEIDLTDGRVAEVDTFGGTLDGLVVVEVEFPDEATADDFVAPPWFGAELTGTPGWSNADLARDGRPAVP